jgi:hypothetical protein
MTSLTKTLFGAALGGGRTMFRARRVAAAFPARKECSRQDTLPLARERRDQDADDWDRDAELGFHSALEIRRVLP